MRKVSKCIVSVLLLLGVMWVLCACKKQTTWQDQYDLGMKYLKEGSYEEAVNAFQIAISIDAKQQKVYVGAADAYMGMAASGAEGVDVDKCYSAAEENYRKALDIDNTQSEVYEKLANVYDEEQDTEKAEKLWEEMQENAFAKGENEKHSENITQADNSAITLSDEEIYALAEIDPQDEVGTDYRIEFSDWNLETDDFEISFKNNTLESGRLAKKIVRNNNTKTCYVIDITVDTMKEGVVFEDDRINHPFILHGEVTKITGNAGNYETEKTELFSYGCTYNVNKMQVYLNEKYGQLLFTDTYYINVHEGDYVTGRMLAYDYEQGKSLGEYFNNGERSENTLESAMAYIPVAYIEQYYGEYGNTDYSHVQEYPLMKDLHTLKASWNFLVSFELQYQSGMGYQNIKIQRNE